MIEDLDEHDIAQSIRQEREVFDGCFLIIEGKNDRACLLRFIERDTCSPQPAGNKTIALAALRLLEEDGLDGVVCLIDTDYDYAFKSEEIKELTSSENVIYTEVHDLDVAILSSSAFENYINLRCDHKIVVRFCASKDNKTLRDIIFDAARPLGCLRLLSHIHPKHMSLSFRDLTFSFVDKNTLDVNIDCLFQEVVSKSWTSLPKEKIKEMYKIILGKITI